MTKVIIAKDFFELETGSYTLRLFLNTESGWIRDCHKATIHEMGPGESFELGYKELLLHQNDDGSFSDIDRGVCPCEKIA